MAVVLVFRYSVIPPGAGFRFSVNRLRPVPLEAGLRFFSRTPSDESRFELRNPNRLPENEHNDFLEVAEKASIF
jgi:hypothetical protein